MTPDEALLGMRTIIESQGPDTANRHYGRNQFTYLLECCDTIGAALNGYEPPEPEEVVDVEDLGLSELLCEAASTEIEVEENIEMLVTAWLTADDIANRLRARLMELNYWWKLEKKRVIPRRPNNGSS